ncbi:MAG: class I SAM-dependent methyltransferase [Thermoplasmatales archaeon]|jgi:ubiquinone/menaquinone biosynthesis C-methylase UbiE|nr:class I SAM-dependent methyltransferase [Candidatus Thermoplasmatota archaeon]MCL6002039.1 class I SAM-dependent methyltransferase [Candidatus Thermoplasmatota archaeon]MDA8054611.1 class I SAM-dependent methyltransferase [Thermoplasmatales archaeon]
MKLDDLKTGRSAEMTGNKSRERAHLHGSRHREDPLPLLKRIGILQGSAVADIGCGDGHFTIPIASMVSESGTVYAVDSNEYALSYLREKITNLGNGETVIKVVNADIMDSGIPERSMDLVFLANVFHDIDDKGEFLKEAKRMLRPSGRIVDLDWTKTETIFGPPYSMRVEETEVESLFEEFGFELADHFAPDPYHYCFVFKSQDSDSDIIGNKRVKEDVN